MSALAALLLTDTVEDHSISASLSLPNTCFAKSKTVRRHGRTVRITTVSYSANRTIGALPSTITLKLATLSSGSHGLRIVFTFHRTVRKNGRSHAASSTATLSTKFKVC